MQVSRALVFMLLALQSPQLFAGQFSLYQKGIYIGQDSQDKRHCFVQVTQWSPKVVKVKTKVSTMGWSNEIALKAATDEQNRTVFLENPGHYSDSVGVKYIKNSRVAVVQDADGKRNCVALKLAN